MTVRVGDREIGQGHPVYVIAEIGSNHDGSLEQAKQLVAAAASAGADAAKFQLYRTLELYPGRETPGAIPDAWLPVLQRTARDHGIDFLCSVFSLETLDAYMRVSPPAIKIASPEATNLELLAAAASHCVPVIVATGACGWDQLDAIHGVIDWDLVLLHCVSAYPADPLEMNLSVIGGMAKRYGVRVGLSDHTRDSTVVPSLAVAAGACMIEKHLTFNRRAHGPDHGFALEPRHFKAMVRDIRYAEQVMGDGVKRVMPSEDPHDRR